MQCSTCKRNFCHPSVIFCTNKLHWHFIAFNSTSIARATQKCSLWLSLKLKIEHSSICACAKLLRYFAIKLINLFRLLSNSKFESNENFLHKEEPWPSCIMQSSFNISFSSNRLHTFLGRNIFRTNSRILYMHFPLSLRERERETHQHLCAKRQRRMWVRRKSETAQNQRNIFNHWMNAWKSPWMLTKHFRRWCAQWLFTVCRWWWW